jgi:hypothetical protein
MHTATYPMNNFGIGGVTAATTLLNSAGVEYNLPHNFPYQQNNDFPFSSSSHFKAETQRGRSIGENSLAAASNIFSSSSVASSYINNNLSGSTIIDDDFPHLGGGSGWGIGLSPAAQPQLPTNFNYGGPTLAPSPLSMQQQQQYKPPSYMQPNLSSVFQSKPYANFLRGDVNTMDNGFHIQNEDFPALPAATTNHSQQSTQKSIGDTDSLCEDSSMKEHQSQFSDGNPFPSLETKPGIQTHPDGRVTNIPPGMLNDQYGMAGLLTFLRTIESDPSIVALALGHDLTNLGLNLNSSKRNLFLTFGGPWADFPCRIQDLDAKVPEEYLTNATIRDKLPNIKLNKLHEDVLFYLFYNCPSEVYQLAAASELYDRDWRFHKTERVWIMRAPNPPREHTGSYEKSSYNIFDPSQWRKIPREMIIEYKDLEGKPCPSVNPTSAKSSMNAANNLDGVPIQPMCGGGNGL